jgi:CPA2 family monovalent cation:H+ antiporter-2
MILGDTEFKYRIISDIKPFQDMLLGLFFLSIGASLNIEFLWNNITSLSLFFVGLFLLKFLAISLPIYFSKKNLHKSIIVALKLCNVSEIVFVILASLYKTLSISTYEYDFFKTVTFLFFLASPLANNLFNMFFKIPESLNISSKGKQSQYDVVIIGYNENIKSIVFMLQERDITYVVIEGNLSKVKTGLANNVNLIYGDGLNHKMLEEIKIKDSRIMFLNFPITKKFTEQIKSIAQSFPNIHLLALSNSEEKDLPEKIGVQIVTNPCIEESINIARIIFKSINAETKDIDLEDYIDTVRNRFYENNKL